MRQNFRNILERIHGQQSNMLPVRRYVRDRRGFWLPAALEQKDGSETPSAKHEKPSLTAGKATIIAAIIYGLFLLLSSLLNVYLNSALNSSTTQDSTNIIAPSQYEEAIDKRRQSIYQDKGLSDKEKLMQLELLKQLQEEINGREDPEALEQNIPDAEIIDEQTNKLIWVNAQRLLESNKISVLDILGSASSGRLKLTPIDLFRLIENMSDSHIADPLALDKQLTNNLEIMNTDKEFNVYSEYEIVNIMRLIYLESSHNPSIEPARFTGALMNTVNKFIQSIPSLAATYLSMFVLLSFLRRKKKGENILIA